MAVKIHVEYCGGWGYRPKYEKFKKQLTAAVPDVDLEFDSYATPSKSGFFEVQVNGKLVHSKKGGDGYMDSEAKLQKVVEAVKVASC